MSVAPDQFPTSGICLAGPGCSQCCLWREGCLESMLVAGVFPALGGTWSGSREVLVWLSKRADVYIGNQDSQREPALIKCVTFRRLCVGSRQ